MPRPVHFEISADDPERALHFYQEVFGWKSQKWDGPQDYWLISTGENAEPGIDGGLMPRRPRPARRQHHPGRLGRFLSRKQAQGVQIIEGKIPIPGVGYLAYCQDTEGNPFGIMEMDEAAA